MHGTPPLPFTQLWEHAVEHYAHSTFLLFRDATETDTAWTYKEFGVLVERTVARLRSLGVGPGSVVHLCLRNSPAFILAWFAAARLGACMVPVDPASRPRDLANQVGRTRPLVGIVATDRAATYREGAAGQVPHVLEVNEDATDTHPGSALLETNADPVRSDVGRADRLAVMFTSGTTSEPKGVVLTQANYGYLATTMSALAGLRGEHRWFVTLPLFHGNAQFYCVAPAVVSGASVALTHTFSASRWVQQAHALEATHASLFAAPIRMILARTPEHTPPLELEHVWYAQNLTAAHYEEFAHLVGTRPRQIYGMTETTAVVTCDQSFSPAHDSIGTVVPGRKIRLLRQEDDLTAPTDEDSGVLTLAGTPGVELFQEYLDDQATTSRSFTHQEGHTWFRTGDLVQRAPDGSLRFIGRVDDVIKVAGENVSLTEVETALSQAPGVLEAAVLAKPDPIRDHVPIAYIVARTPATPPRVADLQAWAETNLTPQTRPREWHILRELPRTSVGKIRRAALGKHEA